MKDFFKKINYIISAGIIVSFVTVISILIGNSHQLNEGISLSRKTLFDGEIGILLIGIVTIVTVWFVIKKIIDHQFSFLKK